MATWSDFYTQDSSSPLMEQLTFFHDHTLMILLAITVTIAYLMSTICVNNYTNKFLLESQMIELIWTITPTIILIFIALPSLQLLYLLDEMNLPSISIKTMGHQWYWSYEFSDFKKMEFDSYMITEEKNNFKFRLLDVDNHLPIPFKSQIRMIVSSTDVIHSWTIPSAGIKIDATPGRLNQVAFFVSRPGILFGQCSEICGTNHSFMPIVMESISPKSFMNWVKNF
uniref:Cytochrome c oxidase subunit 2 n=1 Tax=Rhagophthalmus ohbai TaxID=71225 RepID=A4PCG4_9COLE|nr:cytochrome c oxidase subunit II [Rhagophthalmus ohbai]BAF52861.1 cytochrome c oxidase subunit II [Rhagophthalmus ohbai]